MNAASCGVHFAGHVCMYIIIYASSICYGKLEGCCGSRTAISANVRRAAGALFGAFAARELQRHIIYIYKVAGIRGSSRVGKTGANKNFAREPRAGKAEYVRRDEEKEKKREGVKKKLYAPPEFFAQCAESGALVRSEIARVSEKECGVGFLVGRDGRGFTEHTLVGRWSQDLAKFIRLHNPLNHACTSLFYTRNPLLLTSLLFRPRLVLVLSPRARAFSSHSCFLLARGCIYRFRVDHREAASHEDAHVVSRALALFCSFQTARATRDQKHQQQGE